MTQPFLSSRFPAVVRFWQQVRITKSCWVWLGASGGRDGRGYIRVGGKSTIASRYSWVLFFGCIPEKKHVLHRCDNPLCVNPDHLFLGSHSDNMVDAFLKGRKTVVGTKNPRAILTEEDVREIRRRYPVEGGPSLAEEFGLDRTQPHRIYKRITWKHVP